MTHRKGWAAVSILIAAWIGTNAQAGVLEADLAITKTNGVATSIPGSQVTYTIVASNDGPSDAPGTTVEDLFPSTLNCTWTCVASAGSSCTAAGMGNISDVINLLVGGSATYTAVCDIDAAATGTLDNTATITADVAVPDNNQTNNSATDSDTLTPTADLSIAKTDGAVSSTPGTPITYTIVASNAGPSDVPGAGVSDTFAAALQNCSWTSVAAGGASGNTSGAGDINETLNLPVGASVTYTVDCDIDPAATGTLDNTATIDGGKAASDPDTGNNDATDSNTLTAVADLSITKTDNTVAQTAGDPISYVIVASNAGPSAVSDAVVTDIFQAPLENCSWVSTASGGATGNSNASGDLSDVLFMPPGSSVTYDIVCDIPPDAAGSLSNTATISSVAAEDPTPDNGSATDDDTIVFSALPVPALGWAGLTLLLGLLALVGVVTLRRRAMS